MTLKVEAIYSEINLEVSISPALQSVLQDVKSFGDVNIRTGSYSLQLKAGRKDQAQYLVPNVPGIDKTHTILEGVTATDILYSRGISIVQVTIAKSTAIKVMGNYSGHSNTMTFIIHTDLH